MIFENPPSNHKELLVYKDCISKLFAVNSSALFPVNSRERARIITLEFLARAQNSISIVTTRFQPKYNLGENSFQFWGWPPIVDGIELFLKKGGRLEVLMRNGSGIDPTHPLHNVLMRYNDQFIIKRLIEATSISSKSIPHTMIVSDTYSFRIQPYNESDKSFSAIASVCAPKGARKLSLLFDSYFNSTAHRDSSSISCKRMKTVPISTNRRKTKFR